MILNIGYAWNVGQFAAGYLLSWIGEIVWMSSGSPNPQAWELIQEIADRMTVLGDEKAKEFAAKFREYPYDGDAALSKGQAVTEGNNGGSIDDKGDEGDASGFGIVYTEVNLDEVG